mmetsp:Transcript_131981/g.240028  ORF Transcript_131981/g.240028 Transcript_131981/m.240028 type:complete len:311 (-) Transcript_131981:97-1029(-)
MHLDAAPSVQQLQAWYEEASRLERHTVTLSAKVREGERQMASAQQEAMEIRSRKEQAAANLPRHGRTRRLLEERLAEAEAALREELDNGLKRARDNKGLRRSLHLAQKRTGRVAVQVEELEEALAEEADLEDIAGEEGEQLRHAIHGMEDVQYFLAQRVAFQREKRLRLKALARSKLEKVEQGQSGLRSQVADFESEVEQWRQRLAEQEVRTATVKMEVVKCEEAAARASAYARAELESKRDMHRQLLDVQRAHEKLRTDLEATLKRLEEMNAEEAQAQQHWRSHHMAALDARIDARRQLDQDIIVAEAR